MNAHLSTTKYKKKRRKKKSSAVIKNNQTFNIWNTVSKTSTKKKHGNSDEDDTKSLINLLFAWRNKKLQQKPKRSWRRETLTSYLKCKTLKRSKLDRKNVRFVPFFVALVWFGLCNERWATLDFSVRNCVRFFWVWEERAGDCLLLREGRRLDSRRRSKILLETGFFFFIQLFGGSCFGESNLLEFTRRWHHLPHQPLWPPLVSPRQWLVLFLIFTILISVNLAKIFYYPRFAEISIYPLSLKNLDHL